MVKKSNTRVMLTLSKETEKYLDEIADLYGMTRNAALQMSIIVFHNFHLRKER